MIKKLLNQISDHPLSVLIISSLLFLSLGFWQDGINLDSATYSVIARNMANSGDWFSPTYTEYYLYKFADHPPLVFWLQGIVFKMLGATDTTARLVGAFFTSGSVIMVYFIGKKLIDQKFGVISGLILLLTYNFMQIGNSTLLDVPMTFFVLLALYAIISFQKDKLNLRNTIICSSGLSGAFLAKGIVSAPIWGTLFLAALFFNRNWLKNKFFWFAPAVAIFVVSCYLLLDFNFNNGRFVNYYFPNLINRSNMGSVLGLHTEWFEFPLRFVTLYLPFVLLLPIGIFEVVKNKKKIFAPVIVIFIAYLLFYMMAPKILYHYFVPLYAISSLIASIYLHSKFSERHIRTAIPIFLIFFIALAGAAGLSGMPIHHIRSPELYEFNNKMNNFLFSKDSKDGLLIGDGVPNWEHVAKTAWYWHSNVLQVASVEIARDSLRSRKFAYILVNKLQKLNKETLELLGLSEIEKNELISIYTLDTPGK